MERDFSTLIIIAALTLITSTATAVNEFTRVFDFPPFWSDLLLSAGTLAVAYYLFLHQSKQRKFAAGSSPFQTIKRRTGSYAVPALVVALALVSARRPIEAFTQGTWRACGVINSQCDTVRNTRCVKLYDDRGRQTTNECYSLDGSNYFDTSLDTALMSRWTYHPAQLSLRCGRSSDGPLVTIPRRLVNNNNCDGTMDY